jgi:predicted kinase
LSDSANFVVIRSDVVRKELAGLSILEHPRADVRRWLYSPEWTERTYAECLRRAERLLWQGKRVLVDATFREEHQRQEFLQTAIRYGVPTAILFCEAKPETMQQRLANRSEDASDADWSVYVQAARNWQQAGTLTRRLASIVSSEGSPEQAHDQALEALGLLGLHG